MTSVSGLISSAIASYKSSLTIKVPMLFANEMGLSKVVAMTVTDISSLPISKG